VVCYVPWDVMVYFTEQTVASCCGCIQIRRYEGKFQKFLPRRRRQYLSSLSLSEGSVVVSWSFYYLNLTNSVTGAIVLRGLAIW
jgi:hypothetical protein